MKSGEVIFTFPDSLGSVDKIVGNLFVMFSNSEKKRCCLLTIIETVLQPDRLLLFPFSWKK